MLSLCLATHIKSRKTNALEPPTVPETIKRQRVGTGFFFSSSDSDEGILK